MRVRLHNPITGRSRTYRATTTMTTAHSESHYGIPVMVLDDGEILDAQNVVLQAAELIEPPKNKGQRAMLAAWLDNINAMIGGM